MVSNDCRFTINGIDYSLGWEDLVDDYRKDGVQVCDVRLQSLDIRQKDQ